LIIELVEDFVDSRLVLTPDYINTGLPWFISRFLIRDEGNAYFFSIRGFCKIILAFP
jgi:hypothetical protein